MSRDWRLQIYSGEFEGKIFELKQFQSTKNNDHEHCEFCGKKITDMELKDTDKEGYMLFDEKNKQSRWVCQKCFNDFKETLDLKSK